MTTNTKESSTKIIKLCFALSFSSLFTIFLFLWLSLFDVDDGLHCFWQAIRFYFSKLGLFAVLYFIFSFWLIFKLAKNWWTAKEHPVRKYWLLFCIVFFFWSPIGGIFSYCILYDWIYIELGNSGYLYKLHLFLANFGIDYMSDHDRQLFCR